MPQVKIGLGTVTGDITFTVLIRIEGAGINIYVRIKFLNCDGVAPGLKELGQ